MISPVQSRMYQKSTKVGRIYWKGRFWAWSIGLWQIFLIRIAYIPVNFSWAVRLAGLPKVTIAPLQRTQRVQQRTSCSALDYCNGVFAGLPAGLFNRLHSVLRASARLVLGLPSRAPVMSAIRDTLHCLGYPQRVTFKLCLTTYKCLHRVAPPYLTWFCTPLFAVAGRKHLRSADQM